MERWFPLDTPRLILREIAEEVRQLFRRRELNGNQDRSGGGFRFSPASFAVFLR